MLWKYHCTLEKDIHTEDNFICFHFLGPQVKVKNFITVIENDKISQKLFFLLFFFMCVCVYIYITNIK